MQTLSDPKILSCDVKHVRKFYFCDEELFKLLDSRLHALLTGGENAFLRVPKFEGKFGK